LTTRILCFLAQGLFKVSSVVVQKAQRSFFFVLAFACFVLQQCFDDDVILKACLLPVSLLCVCVCVCVCGQGGAGEAEGQGALHEDAPGGQDGPGQGRPRPPRHRQETAGGRGQEEGGGEKMYGCSQNDHCYLVFLVLQCDHFKCDLGPFLYVDIQMK